MEHLLELLRILLSWPLIFLALVIYFREEIREFLPAMARRLTKAPGGWEFSVEQRALNDAISKGAEELANQPGELADFAKNQVEKFVQSRTAASALENNSLSGCRILWVDDKPLNNEYEANLFRSMGAKIDQVTSTEAALSRLREKSFDLVISDVRRTEGGVSNKDAGYELLESMLIQAEHPPLVFYTATKTSLDKHRTQAAAGVSHRSAELANLVLSTIEAGNAQY